MSGTPANAASTWTAWQLIDSAFPTGAFAHSWGLEAAWQQGALDGSSGLPGFLIASLWQTGYSVLPLLNEGWRESSRLGALDEIADAFLLNAVANRASRIQGRALAATAARIWPTDRVFDIKRIADATCAHLAPLSGAVFSALDQPLRTAQQAALFATTRGVLSAAVRLGSIGSYEAQRLQQGCMGTMDEVLERCSALDVDDLTQTAPLLDLYQAGHDRLYSRLFQS